MSIFYRLYQSKNDKSVTYGKWYGRVVTMGETGSAGIKNIRNKKRTSAEGKFLLVTPAGFKPTTF